MQIIQIFLGLLALFLAWVLIFKKPLIFKLNAFMREHIFTDHLVLFSGGRMALLLLVLGVVALYSGIDSVTRDQNFRPRLVSKIFDHAQEDYKKGDYEAALIKCRELLTVNPTNQSALELMMRAQWALGQKEEANQTLRKMIQINPEYSLKNSPVSKNFPAHREKKKK